MVILNRINLSQWDSILKKIFKKTTSRKIKNAAEMK